MLYKTLVCKKKKAGSISAGNKHVTSLKMWESICYWNTSISQEYHLLIVTKETATTVWLWSYYSTGNNTVLQ